MVDEKSSGSFLPGNMHAHDKKETQVVQKDKIKFVLKRASKNLLFCLFRLR